jgi:hypothetical protein
MSDEHRSWDKKVQKLDQMHSDTAKQLLSEAKRQADKK